VTRQALTPRQAEDSFAHEMGDVADDIRQDIAVDLGARPLRVFLVWVGTSGEERGSGEEREVARREIVPSPAVTDLSAALLNPFTAGRYPVGTVRLTEVSVRLTRDELRGDRIPAAPPPPGKKQQDDYPRELGRRVDPELVDFFYEVVDDGRGDDPARRQRYHLAAEPDLQAENAQWTVLLERAHEERTRQARSRLGDDPDRPDFP
jgi:hypothetical protein